MRICGKIKPAVQVGTSVVSSHMNSGAAISRRFSPKSRCVRLENRDSELGNSYLSRIDDAVGKRKAEAKNNAR